MCAAIAFHRIISESIELSRWGINTSVAWLICVAWTTQIIFVVVAKVFVMMQADRASMMLVLVLTEGLVASSCCYIKVDHFGRRDLLAQ